MPAEVNGMESLQTRKAAHDGVCVSQPLGAGQPGAQDRGNAQIFHLMTTGRSPGHCEPSIATGVAQ